MTFIPVRLRRGKRIHLLSEDSDSPKETLCGLNGDGAIVSDVWSDCRKCASYGARRSPR